MRHPSEEAVVVKSRKRTLLAAAAVAALAGSVAASASPGGQRSPSPRGGTYRVGWELDQGRIALLGGFDPSTEITWGTSGIYTNLLIRTLVGYNHVAGTAGAKLVPDLAVRVPAPTSAGRTYTFRLKRGIRFGPPVNREITARDVRYAIERVVRPSNGSLLAALFSDLRGFAAYRNGRARSIAGIVTPGPKTIVFHLARPVGDFLHRLALPAAGPIPREVGRCFEGRPGYGSDLIASGPYTIEGSSAVGIGSCGSLRPMRGISERQIVLVRNPRYDRGTDTRTARENNPDRFVFVADPESGVLTAYAPNMIRRLTAGELDDAFLPSFWPLIVREYAPRAARLGRLRLDPWGELLFISMNLTQPPFDDVHVRRAMNWIMDRAALRDTYGGPTAGRIAGHILPDELLDGALEGYAPFKTAGGHGSLRRARAEMRKSRYATRNGICIARACKSVRVGAAGPYPPSQRVKQIVKQRAGLIGIRLINRARPLDVPASNNQLVVNAQWVQPWPDPSGFMLPLFSGPSITPTGNFNWSLVGITPAQARKLGVKGHVRGVPSVDADIGRCNALAGALRTGCWARLDRKLTTQVVPVIPFLWRNAITILGGQVARWGWDRSTGTTAYAHVALKR
jgi:peptide/nickel transport system substrate-binding protein